MDSREEMIFMEKMLLHACCAPCSTSVLERLQNDFELTVYFFNPNIYPEREYGVRRDEMREFLKTAYRGGIKVIEEEYDHNDFLNKVKGLENCKEGGDRCRACFELRLLKTAKKAKELGFDTFTTTLSVSPYKNAKLLNEIGNSVGQAVGIKYYESDFKKKDGYLRSIRLSAEYGLYRQNYCGCEFSRRGECDEKKE